MNDDLPDDATTGASSPAPKKPRKAAATRAAEPTAAATPPVAKTAKKTAKKTVSATPAEPTAASTPPVAKTAKKTAAAPIGEVVPVKKKRASRSKKSRPPFEVAGEFCQPGKRMRLELPIGNLMSGTPVALPLIVVHGKKDGPVVWLSAAIHGDEICGVEIIRKVLDKLNAAAMSGTVIAAPVVNVHGFNTNDRYLPDRRDLNRSFPGSPRGSLASRIAHLFMKEIVSRSDVGIDLHTGSDLRTNLPQIRCDLDNQRTLGLARVFGAPIIIDARLRDGSLRQAAAEGGKTVLLFEGGEASRFDPIAIAAGTAGVIRTLNFLGVTSIETSEAPPCLYSRSTSWTRAARSGIVHLDARLGERVLAKQQVATIYDPYGKVLASIRSRHDGIIIGHSQRPLVNRGDALSHVAKVMTDPPMPGSNEKSSVDVDED